MIIDMSKKRCTQVMINGKPLEASKTYKIATNSYLAAGGDGYRIFLKAIDAYDSSMFQRGVLIEYIEHLGGRIKPQTYGRIHILSFHHPDGAVAGMAYNLVGDTAEEKLLAP